MKATEKDLRSREIIEAYISQINWDWLFLKGQMIFGGILGIGILVFLLWFAR